MFNREKILKGLYQEAGAIPEWIQFRVVGSIVHDGVFKVELDVNSGKTEGESGQAVFDEALENSKVWWPKPSRGWGNVMAVMPEEGSVYITDTNVREAPSTNTYIRFYPRDFLTAVREFWREQVEGDQAIQYQSSIGEKQYLDDFGLDSQPFDYLREGQKKVFEIVDYRASFLWGPPGTGKTTTLGALIAACVTQQSGKRILLLSTTNQAVDQALIAADKALEGLPGATHKHRDSLVRVGARFNPENYHGRDHLIPVFDNTVLRELRAHERARPGHDADEEVIVKWNQRRRKLQERLQESMQKMVADKKIISMTLSRAIFDLDVLKKIPKFDLVVFDEASQLSMASVLPLMQLGKRFVFAGDDKQLSPIVVSRYPEALEVLGTSPFRYKPAAYEGDNLAFLDEQSRMAIDICNVVSNVFYSGKLHVAEDALGEDSWKSARTFPFSEMSETQEFMACEVSENGSFSRKWNGFIRYVSALRIVEILTKSVDENNNLNTDILILTPFRAQRALIKTMLRQENINGVRVSTVHSVQGGQASIVIFDPVKGDENFLRNESGKRLINVAVSRAEAKLIVFYSHAEISGTKSNDFLKRMSNIQSSGDIDRNRVPDFLNMVMDAEKLKKHVGDHVAHGGRIWLIENFDEVSDEVFMTSLETGETKRFILSVVRRRVPQ